MTSGADYVGSGEKEGRSPRLIVAYRMRANFLARVEPGGDHQEDVHENVVVLEM
jgi:hypothetical protein